MEVSDATFHELIDRAFESLPQRHRDRVRNVAIVTADEPSEQQRRELKLRCNETLLGLYSGVPLTQRQGREPMVPDVITLFKYPILEQSSDEASLYETIRHTLWHEVAHYFGLNHAEIHAREK